MFRLITDLLCSIILMTSSLHAQTIINDVTKINPIPVRDVLRPTSLEEIKSAVQSQVGPISIGGGRYSMGGQTATQGALQIDMRGYNKIIKLDVTAKKITVQAGIRWRDIQEEIDKHDLSIKIMQTYSNFTVGGSLSVNAHGRYLGAGPVIGSVDSFKIVLAHGDQVQASRTENKEIFFAAVGGYGGVGVITEVTLNLVPNEKLRREVENIPVGQYREHFLKTIRDRKDARLHNADLYPPDYQKVRLETWYHTDQTPTIPTRLIPRDRTYWVEPNAISSISSLPFGSVARQKILDPLRSQKQVIVWRNYEASYDVAQLEPMTPRLLFTYVLQEYFVPIDKFDEFVPKLRNIFLRNHVNVINVSIRHSPADKETYLSWAPQEVFSFVVYYKQATTESARRNVGIWTREMIDAVLSVNGSYYLPYQIHGTPEQFRKAYPNYKKFFDLKQKLDPQYKFRNQLWDRYYHP